MIRRQPGKNVDGAPPTAVGALRGGRPSLVVGVTVAALAVAVATAAIWPLRHIAPVVSLSVVYLPAVLLVSIYWGPALGLATSLVSAAAFNFFHLPPTGHFALVDSRNWAALAAFVVVAVGTSTIAEVARSRRDALQSEAIETAALRRSDEIKTALLRAVSHDLRSPLTAIVAAGHALGAGSLSRSDRAELSNAVVEEGTRLATLVDKLLDLSKLQAGSASPRCDWVSIEELVTAAGDGLGDPRADIRLSIDPGLPEVLADAAQLERAFANLLENARRYSGGRPISIRARHAGPDVMVSVVDQGPGMEAAELQRIFEPFYRGRDAGAAQWTGSGLGLAITKGFVEANGGTIAVQSLPGQGTRFQVSLPVAERAPVRAPA